METATEYIRRIYKTAEYHYLYNDLHGFLLKAFKTLNPGTVFIDNWHLHLLTEVLEAAAKKELQRIIINVPPRNLKSTIASVAFPAWLLARAPTERIITVSYTQVLSTKHSIDCRRVMLSPWFKRLFPQSRIALGNNTQNRFTTMSNGYRFATSVGGSITGDGGNFLIIDDPHNPTKISHPGDRKRVIDWFQNTLMSRIDDKKNGVVILVMQRLHCEDLTGFLLENQPGLWYHVVLKSYNEDATDIIFKDKIYKTIAPGEALHAAREDYTAVKKIQLEIGNYAFAAQYQQSPIAMVNQLISAEYFHYYDQLPQPDHIVMSIDCAVNFSEKSDYSAIAMIGVKGELSYVIIVHQLKIHYSDLRNSILQLSKQYQPSFVLVENRGHGGAILQEMQRDTCLKIISIAPKLSKQARFTKLAAAIESGKLLLPKNKIFVTNLIAEITQFPHGDHDDQVDALSQYIEWIYKYTDSASKPRIRRI